MTYEITTELTTQARDGGHEGRRLEEITVIRNSSLSSRLLFLRPGFLGLGLQKADDVLSEFGGGGVTGGGIFGQGS